MPEANKAFARKPLKILAFSGQMISTWPVSTSHVVYAFSRLTEETVAEAVDAATVPRLVRTKDDLQRSADAAS